MDTDNQIKITYINHSGFSVETKSCVMVFDYWKGELPQWPKEKPLLVFSSHKHQDHFNPEIFTIFADYAHVLYILSPDIRKAVKQMSKFDEALSAMYKDDKEPENIVYPEKNGECSYTIPGTDGEQVWVKTLNSTDIGVAFLVKCDGKMIFHSGDLNNWCWEDDPLLQKKQMEQAYKREIYKLVGIPIDAAFVPLDPRLGDNYRLGMDLFLEMVDARRVFPMHFWQKCETVADYWESLPEEKQAVLVKIDRQGSTWEI